MVGGHCRLARLSPVPSLPASGRAPPDASHTHAQVTGGEGKGVRFVPILVSGETEGTSSSHVTSRLLFKTALEP